MSFDQMDSGRVRADDLRLASYLMKNWHTTPFEMIEVWIEMKLPIFVARQFVRHRTVSINEVSGRYVTLPQEWYIPKLENVGIKSASAKQGRDIVQMGDEDKRKAQKFIDRLNDICVLSYSSYLEAISDGIPAELARLHLHLNHYTHWIWKQDLHNLMHFMSLRDHSHAQFEAQVYASAVADMLRQHLPYSMELYDTHRRR